jgi:hypothetical protein
MTWLGVLLLALGLGDLIAGDMAGRPRSHTRAALGVLVALVTILGCSILLQLPRAAVGEPLACSLLITVPWMFLRVDSSRTPLTRWRAGLALLLLLVFLCTATGLSGRWHHAPGSRVTDWLRALPFEGLAQQPTARVVLALGLASVLMSTANGIVRTMLAVASAQLASSEAKLNGGRYIGVLERLLILVLVIAGEPTTAALVVSAKSVLRFPELSRSARQGGRKGREKVDMLTEYFLLGSLLSWSLALAATSLLRA